METTDDSGDDPLKEVDAMFEEHFNHVDNLSHLRDTASWVDARVPVDSMKASYDRESQVGKLVLWYEYYDGAPEPPDGGPAEFGRVTSLVKEARGDSCRDEVARKLGTVVEKLEALEMMLFPNVEVDQNE